MTDGKLQITNKAAGWHGDRLILLWAVFDTAGNRLTEWDSRSKAICEFFRMRREAA